jgi:hypothetical protein
LFAFSSTWDNLMQGVDLYFDRWLLTFLNFCDPMAENKKSD